MGRRIALWFYTLWLRAVSSERGLLTPWVVVVALALAWGGGYFVAYQEHATFINGVKRISERLGVLWENESLPTRLATLENHVNVSQQTIDELKEALHQKDRQIDQLNEEIHLYRRVVAPETQAEKLAIFALRVVALPAQEGYALDMVVRRNTTSGGRVNGKARIALRGRTAQGEKKIDIGEVLDTKGRLSFKYFQRLRGKFSLPQDFEPLELAVRVTSRRHGEVERAYLWRDLTTDQVAASES